MFEASQVLFLYVETPLHAGSGTGLGAVDLPIQRERVTDYPIVQASGLKGALRDAFKGTEEEKRLIFGPEAGSDPKHAGAISFSDARLLLFPVRSLVDIFAWTTSRDVLARFQRNTVEAAQISWTLPEAPQRDTALGPRNCSLVPQDEDQLVLEEFAFTLQKDKDVDDIAKWLAKNALPLPKQEGTPEYKYWREKLPNSLVILPEDAFRDFTLYSTEVVTRVRLTKQKTVDPGALWTEEHLPTDTLLYAPVFASAPRVKEEKRPEGLKTAADALKKLREHSPDWLQMGGDETVGRGMVRLRFVGGGQ